MDLQKYIDSEEKKYLLLKVRLKKIAIPSIKGSLQVSNKNGNHQFYHCFRDDNHTVRNYLSKDKMYIAKNLTMKKYVKDLEKAINKRLKILDTLKQLYRSETIDDVYYGLGEVRQALIKPISPTYETLLENWLSTPYTGLHFKNEDSMFVTKKGERVRSKSEKILADTFFDMRIPYKYECPVEFSDGSVFYPDFTFLHPKTRQEIYWEHMGMMDDKKYAEKAMLKIQKYEFNGISQRDRLIITQETKDIPLNIKFIKLMIKNYLRS